jgi:site-specific DNA-methyltransferase (adenine-specific)
VAYTIINNEVEQALEKLDDDSFDAILCDPPYHLTAGKDAKHGFMGKTWDGGDVAFRPSLWSAILRVLKPGGYLIAFGGTRTFHRKMTAIEDGGFELVDTLAWFFTRSTPKSHNISAAIDKKLGGKNIRNGPPVVNTYDGHLRNPDNCTSFNAIEDAQWGHKKSGHSLPTIALETDIGQRWVGHKTALRPTYEPIILAHKPFKASYADNALQYGCGALNIDACRIPLNDGERLKGGKGILLSHVMANSDDTKEFSYTPSPLGRWPTNVLLSEEAAAELDAKVAGADRFFYVPKVSSKERNAGCDTLKNNHPTLKPLALARYLATLIQPPYLGRPRRILVPFSGSGSEMIGALQAGWEDVTGIDDVEEYTSIAEERIKYWLSNLDY